MAKKKINGLFLPVSTQPYRAWESGNKQVELRNNGGAYTFKHVRVGRRVLIRRGYSSPDELWGTIISRAVYHDWDMLFFNNRWDTIAPWAKDRAEASWVLKEYVSISKFDGVIAFGIELDNHRTSAHKCPACRDKGEIPSYQRGRLVGTIPCECQLTAVRPEPMVDTDAVDRFNLAVDDAKRRAGYAPRVSRPSISVTLGDAKALMGSDL